MPASKAYDRAEPGTNCCREPVRVALPRAGGDLSEGMRLIKWKEAGFNDVDFEGHARTAREASLG